MLASGCPNDGFNQAEGYRYLTRLVRASLEAFLESSDPMNPTLVAIANGLRDAPVKLGADNPDNHYESAVIDTTQTYRVWGKRGTVFYLGFGSQSGAYGQPGGLKTVEYKVAGEGIDLNEKGEFEIWLSAEKPEGVSEGQWLRLLPDPKNGLLIVRQTYLDRKTEIPAEVHIERTSGENCGQPSNLDCVKLEEALRTSQMFVAGVSIMFSRWCARFQKHTNQFPWQDQKQWLKVGGDPNIVYYHSYWNLKDDEALVIESEIPECGHWNFQLNNHWMESLDYRYFQVHVNKSSAVYRKDGSVCVVVAHQDPKIEGKPYTWINTVGHHQGQMLWRWTSTPVPHTEEDLPHPQPRVVKFSQLAGELRD